MSLPCLNMASEPSTFLIWDSDAAPPETKGSVIVLWQGFTSTQNPNVISLPGIVESRADALREKYLEWVYELGQTQVKGKRLVQQLELQDGFSYWWMTALAQKFNASGNSQITNAIKLLALEELADEYKPQSIVLVSRDRQIAAVLRQFCHTLNLGFTFRKNNKATNASSLLRSVYGLLPHTLQASIYLLHYLKRIALPIIARKNQYCQYPPKGKISFFDILVHLDKKSSAEGRFFSNYWGDLTTKLRQSNIPTNWFHHYFRYPAIPSISQAQDLIARFNCNEKGTQTHHLNEGRITAKNIAKALELYFQLYRSSIRLHGISRCFHPPHSMLNLWPLFKKEWLDSLRGPSALRHCIWLSLYRDILSGLPQQDLGIYIQENQPWEMALLHYWRQAGHGKLIGVPHTTVRFWDLRYFHAPKNFIEGGDTGHLPLPDLMAVNGPIAKELFLKAGYPLEHLQEVEALRFLYLDKMAKTDRRNERKNIRLLICGDFRAAATHKILTWIREIIHLLSDDFILVFKPHPACPINIDECPGKLNLSDRPITELLEGCDLVFASNTTSAAVDAYCSKIPVIQMLEGEELNLSPLRGLSGVTYVRNAKELAEALSDVGHFMSVQGEPYFFLGDKLTRWKILLSLEA